jgi:hypothetical protein
MKTIALLLALLAPATAHAAGSGCQDTSGPITLEKVRSSATGTEIIGCINRSFDVLSTSAAVAGSTTAVTKLGTIYVNRIGGRDTGTPGIRISSSAYGDAGTYLRWLGTATIEGGAGLGVTFGVSAGSVTTGSMHASSGTFTATGATQYSLAASSGISVAAGGVRAPYFSGTLDGGDIRAGTIDTTKLKAGAIDTARLNTDAVTTAKILAGAVDTSKLGTDSVTSAKILAGAVDTNKLAAWSVDTSKIRGTGNVGQVMTQAADGVVQWAAPSGGGGSVVFTSSVAAFDTTAYSGNTATSYGPCLGNSTVTFSGSGALLSFSGEWYKINTGPVRFRWIVDGQTILSGRDIAVASFPNDGVKLYGVPALPVTGLSSGSHSACLQYYQESAGTFRPYTGNNEFPIYTALGLP